MALNIADYIRQAAIQRGIDPAIALRVAKGEGGLSNPFRHGEGPAPKSQAPQFGPLENSFGPFQLYISGTGAGLGDKALAAGIDPRKNWKAGVDFALDQAKKGGWGPWYGAKAAGITGMMGIDGTPTPASASPVLGSIAPQPPAPAQSPPKSIQEALQPRSPGQSSPLNALAVLGSLAPQGPQFSPVQIAGPSQQQATGLASLVAALRNRMA